MKLKKLGFMNIKREDFLTRSEMRSTLAGSGGDSGCGCGDCSTGEVSGNILYACRHNGCDVRLVTCSSGWILVTCDGCWQGCGNYGGTICGGSHP